MTPSFSRSEREVSAGPNTRLQRMPSGAPPSAAELWNADGDKLPGNEMIFG